MSTPYNANTASRNVEYRDRFTVPYTLDGGSRHDRVLERLLDRQRTTDKFDADVIDKSGETFDSAAAYQTMFEELVHGYEDSRHVLVSEFYLYDDAGWRDETAIELDIARFDPQNQAVYCIETTGKNLDSVREGKDREQKKEIVRQKALSKGTDRIDGVQQYMNRLGWTVEGEIATFYQHGIKGRTDVEVYRYDPDDPEHEAVRHIAPDHVQGGGAR